MAGLGLFDQRVQLAGTGIGRNLLIPKRFAIIQQPISHSMYILGLKLRDCGFNFLHRAHEGKVSGWRARDKPTLVARLQTLSGAPANVASIG